MLAKRALSRLAPEANIAVARDGEEACQLVSPGISLVLLDIRLPRLSGLDVLAKLRSRPELSGVPVVMLTSSDEPSDLRRSYDLGANAYVQKGVDFGSYNQRMSGVVSFWLNVNMIPTVA